MSITASVARQFWFLSHTMARCTIESHRLLRYSKLSAEATSTTHKKKKKKKKKGEKGPASNTRIELAGYQARVQQFTIENPVIPRDSAPLMPLTENLTFYFIYILKFYISNKHYSIKGVVHCNSATKTLTSVFASPAPY